MKTNIGERLYYFRSLKGWSIPKLSKKSGVSKDYLIDLEEGRIHNPGILILFTVIDALEISLKVFFDEESKGYFLEDPMIQKFYQLSVKQRASIEALIDSMENGEY